tara:strand:+ start:3958 stop:4188 length:231 start_codon:yes stop_codon:yes gene_type:complete
MGKMKEIFMQMREAEFNGPLEEFINLQKEEALTEPVDILCPNCLTDKLVQTKNNEMNCTTCGYDFILIDRNTVRFK